MLSEAQRADISEIAVLLVAEEGRPNQGSAERYRGEFAGYRRCLMHTAGHRVADCASDWFRGQYDKFKRCQIQLAGQRQ